VPHATMTPHKSPSACCINSTFSVKAQQCGDELQHGLQISMLGRDLVVLGHKLHPGARVHSWNTCSTAVHQALQQSMSSAPTCGRLLLPQDSNSSPLGATLPQCI
jgi:hypothetical protein